MLLQGESFCLDLFLLDNRQEREQWWKSRYVCFHPLVGLVALRVSYALRYAGQASPGLNIRRRLRSSK